MRSALRPTLVSCDSTHILASLLSGAIVVVIAAISTLLFTLLVLLSSFVTTYFVGGDDDAPVFHYAYWSPLELFRGLVRMTIGILADDNMIDQSVYRRRDRNVQLREPQAPPGILQRLLRRFLLGLPVVGAGSIAHMLLSIPFPFHWLRLRTRRANRQSKDLMTLIVLAVVLAGAARQAPVLCSSFRR